jgi:hypothetical protein
MEVILVTYSRRLTPTAFETRLLGNSNSRQDVLEAIPVRPTVRCNAL